jgi:hypothetical protein
MYERKELSIENLEMRRWIAFFFSNKKKKGKGTRKMTREIMNDGKIAVADIQILNCNKSTTTAIGSSVSVCLSERLRFDFTNF